MVYCRTVHCFLKIWFNKGTHQHESRNGHRPSTKLSDVHLGAYIRQLANNIKIILLAENKGLPLSASKKVVAETPTDEFEAKDLRSVLHLKVDHSSRPLWVVSILPVSLFLLLMMIMNTIWICLRVMKRKKYREYNLGGT